MVTQFLDLALLHFGVSETCSSSTISANPHTSKPWPKDKYRAELLFPDEAAIVTRVHRHLSRSKKNS